MEIETKLIINAALILVTVISGYFLHKTSKPYNNLVFTVHKFATIGFVVFLSILFFGYARGIELTLFTKTFVLLSGTSILLLMVSGALLSLEKFFDTMLLIHRILTFCFVIFVITALVSIS